MFDNDEFDVLRRGDVDLSRVHIGKRYYILIGSGVQSLASNGRHGFYIVHILSVV